MKFGKKKLRYRGCLLQLTKRNKLLLFLTGQAREAIVSLDINRLSCNQGAENLIEELDKLYLKDSQYSAYEAYEPFEKFCRPKSVNIGNYIIKFECLYNKIKNFNMTLPDGALAYKFLNNANISQQHKQLKHATLTELKYEKILQKFLVTPQIFLAQFKMSKALRLNQLTIKMHFKVAVTIFFHQKEVVLILDIETIDFLIGPMMVENLIKI